MKYDFSAALEAIKQGARCAREGWNGKGMFVFLVPGSQFNVSRPPLSEIFPEGTPVSYRPHIDLRAADGTIGVWTPSSTDLLSNDWVIL